MTTSRGMRHMVVDWVTIFICIALVLIGWLMIYSTDISTTSNSLFNLESLYGRQLVWIGVSTVLGLSCFILPTQFWRNFSLPIYIGCILFLIAVLIFGKEINGARSWFSFGSFTFQPSELAKFGTALAISFLASHTSFNFRKRSDYLSLCGCLALPMFLIFLQPDAGSMITFLSFFILFYRLGLSSTYYILGFSLFFLFVASILLPYLLILCILACLLCIFLIYSFLDKPISYYFFIGVLFLISADVILYQIENMAFLIGINICFVTILSIFILYKKYLRELIVTTSITGIALLFCFLVKISFDSLLASHQKDRIYVWLSPDKSDPRGSLYNLLQSKIAIGSGGFSGKGFLEGNMTKLNFIPEQSTDFIFCTVGEEHGFIGSIVLIFLYAFLIYRIFSFGDKCRLSFSRNYCYAFGGFLLLHFFVNIGMTMGLVPIIGIPLPFISYGGSSLMIFSIFLGVYIRLSMDKKII